MARFLGLKWDDRSSSWSIIGKERSAVLIAHKVERWMIDNPPTFPPSTVAVARVPPGADLEQFVATLPAPDGHFDDCPLCRAGSAHTIH